MAPILLTIAIAAVKPRISTKIAETSCRSRCIGPHLSRDQILIRIQVKVHRGAPDACNTVFLPICVNPTYLIISSAGTGCSGHGSECVLRKDHRNYSDSAVRPVRRCFGAGAAGEQHFRLTGLHRPKLGRADPVSGGLQNRYGCSRARTLAAVPARGLSGTRVGEGTAGEMQ